MSRWTKDVSMDQGCVDGPRVCRRNKNEMDHETTDSTVIWGRNSKFCKFIRPPSPAFILKISASRKSHRFSVDARKLEIRTEITW